MNELSTLNNVFEYVNENGLKINGLSNINNALSVHYIVYRVDNLVNGKYYIGQHQTENPVDCYSGSGKALMFAQAKYGISSFCKTLLFDFDNFNDMNNKEMELVQLSNCYPYDLMSYNLIPGGKYIGTLNGELNPLYGIPFTEDHKSKISKALTGIPKSEEHKKHISQSRTGQPSTWTLLSDEQKKTITQKISKSHKKIIHNKEWNERVSKGLRNRTPEQKAQSYQKFINTLRNHTEDEKKQIWLNRSNASKGRIIKDTSKIKSAQQAIWNNPTKKQQILAKRAKTYALKSKEERQKINKKRGSGKDKNIINSALKILKKYNINISTLNLESFPLKEYKSVSKNQRTRRLLILEKWLNSININVELVTTNIWVTNGKINIKTSKNFIPQGFYIGLTQSKLNKKINCK